MKAPHWSAERWLFAFDASVMIGVGGMAFGGSANHVYHLAIQHGQQGFGAISITALAEVLFAYSGLEVRRRRGWGKIIPIAWLTIAAAFIVWANFESTSDHTITGYIIAVAPAIIFAGIATLAETRKWKPGSRGETVTGVEAETVAVAARRDQDEPVQQLRATVAMVAQPAQPSDPAPAEPRRRVSRRRATGATTRQARQDELRAAGKEWLASQATGWPQGRQEVAQRLGVSPQRAGTLIERWRNDPDLSDDLLNV